jgi:hypothetical protein
VGLGGFAKLSGSQAKEAVEPFLVAIKRTTNPYDLRSLGAGLGAVTAKLSDSQAREAVAPLVAAIKGTSDPYALGALGEGLGALPAKLNDQEVKEAVEPLLAAIKGTGDPYALEAVGAGLGALPAKFDGQSARAVRGAVDEVLEQTRDPNTFAIYAALSARLTRDEPRERQVARIFELMRHPLSGGDATEKLLALLEQAPGVQTKFGGDLWKAVEWAEMEQKAGRLNGLDLDAPLQIK